MKSHRGSPAPVAAIAAMLLFIGARGACPDDASASPFQNLGFESADVSGAQYHEAPASQALPCWSNDSYYAGYVLYDDVFLDSVGVSVHDAHSFFAPLAGSYTVLLQDGAGDGAPPYYLASAWIAQTGDIPSGAKSLMFESDMSTYISELRVSINGTAIPFTLFSTDGTVNSSYGPVNTYACDIRAFTGQSNAVLEFEKLVHDPTNPGSHGMVDLDAITFSTIIVPEPSSLWLLAVAVLSLAGYYSRGRNRAT